MKNFIIGAVVVAALFAGFYAVVSPSNVELGANPGPLHTNLQEFLAGFTIGASGTSITGYKCTSNTSFNPGAVSATTTVSGTTTATGAVVGDIAFATLATSSQGLAITAEVSAANVITYDISQPDADDGLQIDIATATLKTCFLK